MFSRIRTVAPNKWLLISATGALLAALALVVYSIGMEDSQAADDGYFLSAAEVTQATTSGLSDEQSALIRDGVVTWNDYELAFDRYLKCLEGAGGHLEGSPRVTERRRLSAPIALPDREDGASAQAAIQGCYREHFSLIDQLWSMHNPPSQVELSDARAAFAACLRKQGFSDVPERPAPGELVKFWPSQGGKVPADVFYGCQQQVDDVFHLPGFGG